MDRLIRALREERCRRRTCRRVLAAGFASLSSLFAVLPGGPLSAQTITPCQPAAAPAAAFSVTCLSLSCTFNVTSSPPSNPMFGWDFGDLTSALGPSTSMPHGYPAVGSRARFGNCAWAAPPPARHQHVEISVPAMEIPHLAVVDQGEGIGVDRDRNVPNRGRTVVESRGREVRQHLLLNRAALPDRVVHRESNDIAAWGGIRVALLPRNRTTLDNGCPIAEVPDPPVDGCAIGICRCRSKPDYFNVDFDGSLQISTPQLLANDTPGALFVSANDLAFKAAVDNDGDTLTIGVPSQKTAYGTLGCSTPAAAS